MMKILVLFVTRLILTPPAMTLAALPEPWVTGAPQEQQSCRIEIKKRATLGKLEDPFSVEMPVMVFVADVPWGGWVVTERSREVLEYDVQGVYRRLLGRSGEGPGEFRHPSSVVVDPTDSTWVSDGRGRAVIFGPDGVYSRTLISANLFPIDGFTESGLPFSMLTKVAGISAEPPTWRYAQIWSREGERLSSLGPGHFTPAAQVGRTLELSPAFQSAVLGDTVAAVPGRGEFWLAFWSDSEEWAKIPTDSVRRALRQGRSPRSDRGGKPVAVTSDGRGGFWILGTIRRLSEAEEEDLVRKTAPPRGQVDPYFVRNSPSVSNEVQDGALIHVTPGGRITAGASFDERPWGFANSSQFFTFSEDEIGLIKINIWEFSHDCS